MAKRRKLPKWEAVEYLDTAADHVNVKRLVLVRRPAYCNVYEWGCRTMFVDGSGEVLSFGSPSGAQRKARAHAAKIAGKTPAGWRTCT